MSRLVARCTQAGMTLVELLVTIVILAIALAGVLSVMNLTTARSADPMLTQQATLIAEAYLEEILLKPFIDPSSGTTRICPTAEAGGRVQFDNVCDYNGLSNAGVRDQFNSVVTGLEDYTVNVTVTGDGTVTLGPAANQVNNTGVLRVLKIDVRVQHSAGVDITLTGYRTNYNCNTAGDSACLSL